MNGTTMTEKPKLSDNQMIFQIRQRPSHSKVWDTCSQEQKRRVLSMADGDTLFLDMIFEDMEDEIKEAPANG